MGTIMADPNPYVGPRALRTGESLYGRNRELRELRNLLIAKRIVLLYSPSGAGKSSLIQAGLVPTLEARDFHVWPVLQVHHRPPPEVPPGTNRYLWSVLAGLEATRMPADQLPAEKLATLDLATYLDQRRIAEGYQDEVLILDQLEEILSLDPTDGPAKVAFFTALDAALHDRHRWALLVLREDYLAALDPYRTRFAGGLPTTFRIDLLDSVAARQAIQAPAAAAGIPFADATAAQLVHDLARVVAVDPTGVLLVREGPWIEPVQLQAVCRHLWSTLPPGTREILPMHLSGAATVDQALAAYYATSVADAATAGGISERRLREWCADALITASGTRDQVLQSAAHAGGLPPTAVTSLLESHMLRAEPQRGAIWLELVHDRLIRPIQADNAAWRQTHGPFWAQQVVLWDRQDRPPRLLLTGRDLVRAVAWARQYPDELLAPEQAFLAAGRAQRARTRRRILAALGFGLGAAMFALIVALWLEARQQQARATAQRQIALSRQLASQARIVAATQPDRALLLAAEAHEAADTLEARSSLLATLQAAPYRAILGGYTGRIMALGFSPDGHLLAVAHRNDITLWDMTTHRPRGSTLTGHKAAVTALALDATGVRLASGDIDGAVRLWEIGAASIATVLNASSRDRVLTLAFADDGTSVRALRADGSITTWPLQAPGAGVTTGPGPWGRPAVATLSAGASTLFTADPTGVSRWDLTTGGSTGPPWPASAPLSTLSVSRDGRHLAALTAANQIGVWDAATGTSRLAPFAGPSVLLRSLALDATGMVLATGLDDGTVILWDLADREAGIRFPLRLRASETQPLTHVARDPGSPWLAWSDAAGQVHAGSVEGPADADWLVSPAGSSVTGMAFAAPGTLAIARADTGLAFWDLALRQQLTPAASTAISGVQALAGSSASRYLVTAGADGLLRLWEPGTRALLSPPLGPITATVSALALRPDGQLVATADPATITLWDAGRREALRPPLVAPHVTGLAFSPDGQLLAAAGSDNFLTLWDLAATPHSAQALFGSGDPLYTEPITASVGFSPDGTQLLWTGCGALSASGYCDQGRWRLWDRFTRQPIDPPLDGPGGIRSGLSIGADPRTAATLSGSNLLLWSIDAADWRARACAVANRNLTPAEWHQYLPDVPTRMTCPSVLVGPTVVELQALLTAADRTSRAHDIETALPLWQTLTQQVTAMDDSWLINEVCWRGSLGGAAAAVLPACDHAIALAPEDGRYRDSRGLARVQTGDYPGAIADFTAFLAWAQDTAIPDVVRARRQTWITILSTGHNPLDPATLEELRNE